MMDVHSVQKVKPTGDTPTIKTHNSSVNVSGEVLTACHAHVSKLSTERRDVVYQTKRREENVTPTNKQFIILL